MELAVLILAAGLIVVLDQASKALVVRLLRPGQSWLFSARWPVRIRLLMNARTMPGILRQRRVLIHLWCFAVLGTIVVSFHPVYTGCMMQIALGAAVGGATSNLLDRLCRGAIVDFLDLRIWPVFNIADAALVLGVAGALCRAPMIFE